MESIHAVHPAELKLSSYSGKAIVLDPWTIRKFFPGPDGGPAPIVHSLSDPHNPGAEIKAHKVSIVDIDAKDPRLRSSVEEAYKDYGPGLEVEKRMNCGNGWQLCLEPKFSVGVIVVPAGKHNVTLAWKGDGYINDAQMINWAGERFIWKREFCH